MSGKLTYEQLEGKIRTLESSLEKSKHENKTLQLNRDQIQFISDSMPGHMAYVGANDLVYKFVNHQFEISFGKSCDEIIGSHIKKIIGETNYKFALKYIEKIRAGESVSYENTFNLKTGKRWIRVNYVPDFDEKRNVKGIVVLSYDITEHKQAEETLRQSENKLRTTLDATPFPMAVVDLQDDKIVYWSRSAEKLFGHTAPTASEWYQIAYPDPDYRQDVIERWKPFLEKARESGSPVNTGEYRVTCSDGSERICELYATFLPDNLIVTFNDITERKQAEVTLLESEERIRAIGDNLQGAQLYQLRVAPDGGAMFTYVSSKVEELHECKPEDVLKDASLLFKRVHPADVDEWKKLTKKSIRELCTYDHTVRIVRKSGEIRWHRMISKPQKMDDDSVLFDGVEIDVTERKRMEEALRERLSYEQLLSRVSVLAMETDDLYVFQKKCLKAMGETLNVSRIYLFEHHHETDTMDNTFEWVAEGVLPQKDELQGVSAADIPWWMKVLKSKQIINFSDIGNIPDEGAKTILRLQGILSILVVPLFTAGQYYGFLGFDDCIRHREWSESDAEFLQAVGRIMTGAVEQKRAEDEREKLQDQLSQAQKMESVGRLAGGVAHDFNNMLGVILGHTELALLQADENHDLYSDLKEIQKAAKRSANTTKQLLAFARKDIISPRKLDLNDTVESMLNMLRRLIGEDIDLSWLPTRQLWSVKMDPSQIDQILANLCVNARDAIAGVGKLTIETGRKSFDEEYCKEHPGFIPGDFVLLAVSDNGCGMDKNTLDNLFEPFFTTKEVGKGTGLGLATIYGIIKQNNGFINVYSEPGQGSTFKIYLPRVVDDEDDYTDVPEKKTTSGGTETILLVEDEPSILKITRMMLERNGYGVLSAAKPTEAMKKAKNHSGSIDLLMTDVVMPEMNGRDLAEKVTAIYPEIKLLFMSGYTANVIAHQGILDDGVAFIQKPFSMADMTVKIREVLDKTLDETQG